MDAWLSNDSRGAYIHSCIVFVIDRSWVHFSPQAAQLANFRTPLRLEAFTAMQ